MIVPLKAANQILDSESATLGDVLKCFGQLSQHFNGLEREETRAYMDAAIEVTPTPPLVTPNRNKWKGGHVSGKKNGGMRVVMVAGECVMWSCEWVEQVSLLP